MPNSQLYFFAQVVVSLTRLTPDDVYLTTTPLFHGNAQFMAVYPRSSLEAAPWCVRSSARAAGSTISATPASR